MSDDTTPRETGAEIDALANHTNRHAQRIGLELAKLSYSCIGQTGDKEGDTDALHNIIEAVNALATPRPDAASASVTEVPRADLPKLDQPPESPGWRGDATVTAFRERLELRIRELADHAARVAGYAAGVRVNFKGFDVFLDCLCDAAAGAALAVAPRDAGREEVGYLIAVKAASPPKWLSGFEPDVRQRSLFGRTGEDLIVTRPLFTTLHHEAIRFSRREDADRAINAVAQDFRGLVEVEEHMWTDAGRAAPRDAGREVGPWVQNAADNLAREVLALTRAGALGTRSPVGDALLSYASTRFGDSDPLGHLERAARRGATG